MNSGAKTFVRGGGREEEGFCAEIAKRDWWGHDATVFKAGLGPVLCDQGPDAGGVFVAQGFREGRWCEGKKAVSHSGSGRQEDWTFDVLESLALDGEVGGECEIE